MLLRARHGTQPTGSFAPLLLLPASIESTSNAGARIRGASWKTRGRVQPKTVNEHCLTLHSAGLPRHSRTLAKDPIRPLEAKHKEGISAQTMNRFSARISLRHQPVLAGATGRAARKTANPYDTRRRQCVTTTLAYAVHRGPIISPAKYWARQVYHNNPIAQGVAGACQPVPSGQKQRYVLASTKSKRHHDD